MISMESLDIVSLRGNEWESQSIYVAFGKVEKGLEQSQFSQTRHSIYDDGFVVFVVKIFCNSFIWSILSLSICSRASRK